MLGINYLNRLNQLLAQSYPSSGWTDKKTSFDIIYEATKDFAKKTSCLYGTQTITTVANQANYALNPDFTEVYVENEDDAVKAIKYTNNASVDFWLEQQFYSSQYYANNTTSVLTPSNFAIISKPALDRITGTVTSTAAESSGESNLIDTTANFTNVSVGDDVYNSTQGYIGIVLSKTGTTQLVTAMFNVSNTTSNYSGWTSSDGYVIQPAPRYQIYIDPPPSTTGHTITVPYIQKPSPVYSDIGSYNLMAEAEEAILKYAAWLYKYRDSQPNVGDAYYQYYDKAVRESKNLHGRATGNRKFRMSWKKSG